MDELISLTMDLLERKDGGESFSAKDLRTFGGMIKAKLVEAWPDMSWSSYTNENGIFGTEVHPENLEYNLCFFVSLN